MKPLLLAAGIGLAAFGTAAQDDAQKRREAAIWNAVANRVDRQNDLWFKSGDFPRVIQTLRLSVGLFPTDFDYVTSLGWMLENVEMYDQALAVYIRYRLDNPTLPDSPFPEAQFYFRRKIYAKIPPLLEPSLKDKPHPNSFRILAHSYERMGMLADSARVWKALVDFTPKDDAAKNNLARVEKKMKGGG